MPTVELPQGAVNYRVAGPDTSAEPTVVFLHGLLVNGELWTKAAAMLAARGIRSYAPDLPLGAHTTALNESADTTVDGVVTLILEFLAALGLDDVTLVGNDTGGALCQILVDRDASRVGRLVLTNCDAFDKFPPFPFGMLKFGSSPGRAKLMMQSVAPTFLRHSVLGYGGLVATPLDPALSKRWATPATKDKGVARDVATFLRSIDKRQLLDVSTRLDRFAKPVRLVWGDKDRFFKLSFAERLEAVFPNAELARVEGGRTFVSLDFPDRVAEQIAAVGAGAS